MYAKATSFIQGAGPTRFLRTSGSMQNQPSNHAMISSGRFPGVERSADMSQTALGRI